MAESRPVPTNLMSWPRVADLLPDQKLIVYHLWASRHTTPSGCYLLPLASFAVEISLGVAALQEALRQFVKLGLVDYDPDTGEIFVTDWYRFHKSAGRGRRIIVASIAKIQSARLKQIVINKSGLSEQSHDKSTTSSPTATPTSTSTSTLCMHGVGDAAAPSTPPPGALRAKTKIEIGRPKQRALTTEGVVVWTDQDLLAAAILVQKFGSAAVAAAAATLQAQGIDPLPGRVIKALEQSARQQNLADPAYWIGQQQDTKWAERVVGTEGDDDDHDQ